MAIIELYQTKSSIKQTDSELIFCSAQNSKNPKDEPWLGDGYYFWDTFKENAHWWGRVHYDNKYTIVKVECDLNMETCFDLFGTLKNLKELSEIYELMKSQGLADNKTTVARVLKFMKDQIPTFKSYKSIRACGYNINNGLYKFIRFSRTEGMELTPKVQICLFDTSQHKINNQSVIFPSRASLKTSNSMTSF